MVYKCFDKKSSGVTRTRSETLDTQDKSAVENKIVSNQQLAEALHRPIIKKIEKRKVQSSFLKVFGVLILQMCN